MQRNESGRSLLEMIGTLTIMGILSITAIMGFRYGMNKLKANRIYNDAKLAYVSISSSGGAPYHWAAPEFTPECGYTLSVRRDKDNNNFVLVDSVEDEVCDLLLDMAEDGGEVSLYYLDNQPMTCEEDEQDIVISFAGMEPLIPCDSGGVDDCPDDAQAYCDAERQVCQTCPLGEWANDAGDGCEAVCSGRSDEYTETCVSESQMAEWCCRETQMCSDVVGKCVDAGEMCIYDVGETGDTTMYYTSTCSYEMAPTGDTTMYYTSTCSYEMAPTGDTTMYYTATCGYNLEQTTDADGNITVKFTKMTDNGLSSCGKNQYCRLTWTEQKKAGAVMATGFANDHTGPMYGVCVPMDATTANAQPVYPSSENLLTRKKMNCGENQYCRLTWIEEKKAGAVMATGFANDYVGTMYGVCVPMDATTANAQPVYPSSENLLTRKKMNCGENQYCRLTWIEEKKAGAVMATGFANDYVGTMYGVCVPMEATTANAQPVYPSSENLMSRKEGCPVGQWCNLRWNTAECSKSGASTIQNNHVGPLYGACVDMTAAPGSAKCWTSFDGKNPEDPDE